MENLLEELVRLSRYLGDPSKQYAILGEGNTSVRVDEETFWVKASGTTLANIDASGFVRVRRDAVMEILEDEGAGDGEVKAVLEACRVDRAEQRMPSVETMLHAILLSYPEIRFVGHTHPVYTNALLSSKVAKEAMAGRIFPDQIVSMGHKSVWVPYVDPGLVLAREVKRRMERYIEEEGVLPKCIVMQNHGFIAMGDSVKAITSCTDMAEKSSKILVGAYSAGGPNFLSKKEVDRIFTRPDEHYRLKSIAGG
jgi:rhamnose utilization protein RhaD (predicted bifunctional aldolase and dehydrogenase)